MLPFNPIFPTILTLATFLFACAPNEKGTKVSEEKATDHKFVGLSNEDAIELTEIKKLQDSILWSVVADIETDPVSAKSLEDAADDPAIWLNPNDPAKSIIFGSNKTGGIVAYALDGEEIKYYQTGRINNIDILTTVVGADSSIQLLGCSNRSDQSVDLYFIDANGTLLPARKQQLTVDRTMIDDVYGFCFGTDVQAQKDYLFLNGKNGTMQQYVITYEADSIALALTRTVDFGDQTEGMVADKESGMLYVGAENTGVWKLSITPADSSYKKIIPLSGEDNPNIKYDVEGLAIANYQSKKLLMVSSQGNFSYALFDLSDNDRYLGSIKIIDSDLIDGVEETDGIDVNTNAFGNLFPNGLFVAQDGYNFKEDSLEAQNFKFVDFRKIEQLLNKMQ